MFARRSPVRVKLRFKGVYLAYMSMTSLMNVGGFVGLPFIIGPIIDLQGYTVAFGVVMVIFAFQGILGLLFTFPKITEPAGSR